MLEPEHALTDEQAADRAAMWAAMLWDGAPSGLVEVLARSRLLSLSELTDPVIAELASRVPGVDLAEWFHLMRRAEADRLRIEVVRQVKEGHRSGIAAMLVSHDHGFVRVQVRPDLRRTDYFALTDMVAAVTAQKLLDAAKDALEWRERTRNGRRRI